MVNAADFFTLFRKTYFTNSTAVLLSAWGKAGDTFTDNNVGPISSMYSHDNCHDSAMQENLCFIVTFHHDLRQSQQHHNAATRVLYMYHNGCMS